MNPLAFCCWARCYGVSATPHVQIAANRFLQDPGNSLPIPLIRDSCVFFSGVCNTDTPGTRVLPVYEGAASIARAIFLRRKGGHQQCTNPTPNRKRNTL